MTLFKLKDTHQGIIESLRDQAEMNALEIGEDKEAMPEWDAADLIDELMAALREIADGAKDPADIARKALDPFARMIQNYESGNTTSG